MSSLVNPPPALTVGRLTLGSGSLLSLLTLAGCPEGLKDESAGETGVDSGESGGSNGGEYESGCILVDGGGGYALLADAITVASEGSTIELCDGTYEQSVVLDKGVSIVGASQEGTVIVGQGVEPAVRVEAGAVSVSNLTVTGTYAGIVIDGVSGVDISGVLVSRTEYWGVQSTNATGVVISGCTFDEPGAGGVDITGGQVTVSGSILNGPSSYAFDIGGGADATLTDNTVDGVLMLSDDVSDGYGVNAIDSTVTLSGNSFANVEGMGIYAEGTTLSMSGDTFTDIGFLGLFMFDGELEADGVTVSGALLQGMYVATPTVAISNTTIEVDSALSGELSYAQWGQNGDPWFGGLLVAGDSITLTGVTTRGYNNYGMLLVPYTDGNDAIVALDDVTIEDTGRKGLWLEQAEVTGTGVTVSGLREPELATPCTDDGSSYYVDESVGLFAYQTALQLVASELSGNQGWGLSSYGSSVSIAESLIDGNACSGIINFGGVLTVSGSTLSHANYLGSLWDYEGTSVLTGNNFSDSTSGRTYGPYADKHGNESLYEYTGGQGMDISATSSDLTIEGNTFARGDQAIVMYDSEAAVSNNVFDTYNGNIFYVFQAPSGAHPSFVDNTVIDAGGYVVFNYYSDVEVENLTVEGMRAYSYVYNQYYNGTLSYSYNQSTYPYVLYSYGNSSYPAGLHVDGADVSGADYGFGYSYDTELDFADLALDDVGAATTGNVWTGYWSSTPPVVNIEGLSVQSVSGDGLYLYYSGSSAAYVALHDVSFDVVGSDALYFTGLDAYSLTAADLGRPGGYGLYSYGSLGAGVVTIDDVIVSDAGSYGYYIRGGSLEMTATTAVAGSSTGLKLEATTASVVGNVFSSNASYGMECTTVALASCSENDLSGNGAGEHRGCEDTCAAASGGGGDTADTGGDTAIDSGT